MRGKAVPEFDLYAGRRITPAYAGKRPADQAFCQRQKDHPRLCGEKDPVSVTVFRSTGSPPPMRGKDRQYTMPAVLAGITPAYAGKRVVFEKCLFHA